MISFCQPFEIHNTTRRKIQDCGDLLLCAKRRKVEIRASSQSKEEDLKMGLPLVVLLGIFDSLKVEMQQALDIDFWNTFDPFAAHGLDRFSQTTGFQEWRETLRSMALVHSSWQAHARRLLGHNIVGNRGLTRALVRSPIFGRVDSRAVRLVCRPHFDRPPSRLSPARPMRSHPQCPFSQLFAT